MEAVVMPFYKQWHFFSIKKPWIFSLGGWEDALGLWDGNPIKLDCDDHCTTINVTNSLSNKK